MSTKICFLLSLLGLISLVRADIACNYVKFDANIEYEFLSSQLGTFSLSTNRCQSLRANLDLRVYSTVIDGSMMFTCDSDNKKLNIEYYNDPTCTDLAGNTKVAVNESVKLLQYVVFEIDELHCNEIDCDVGFTFARNCSWLNSDLYLNVSLPPEQCLSFGADFQGISKSVPDEILPDEVVDNLESKSYKYTCCNDNSLLIYNYSDTSCDTEYNRIRISSDYNGTCFEVGDTTWYSDDSEDTYKFVLEWSCANYANCDALGVDFLDDSELPDMCSDTCLDGLDWYGTHKSSHGGDSSTEKGKGEITVTKEEIIGICVGALIVFILTVIGVYFFTRRRRIKREVDRQEEIIVSAEKYAPMIEESDDEEDIVGGKKQKKSSKDNSDEPGGTAGDSTNINMNTKGLSKKEQARATFASMTDSMTIDNAVIQDGTDSDENTSNADITDVEPLNNSVDNVEDAPVKEQQQPHSGNGHIPLKNSEEDEENDNTV